MKKLVVVMSLVLAACGAGDDAAFDPEAGFTQGSDGQLRSLAYAYQPDTSLTYGFTMSMDMDMSIDFEGVDDFEDMSMAVDLAGELGYDIGAGPEPGTTELTMSAEFSELTFSEFTLDGEAMPPELMGDATELGLDEVIPEMTVVIDERGDIVSLTAGDVAVPSEFLNSFGGGFGDPTGMGLQTSIFGPELPFDEVRVGAVWTTEDTQQVPGFGEIKSVTRHEIVAEEQRAGRDTVVIESVTSMDRISLTFADLLEMMTDPALMSASGLTEADVESAQAEFDMFESMGMSFEMEVEYDDLTVTTWLDYEAGLVVATDGSMAATMLMKMETPEGDGKTTMEMTMGMFTILTDDGVSV